MPYILIIGFDGLHLSVGQIPYISVFLFPGIRRRSSHPISNQLKEWAESKFIKKVPVTSDMVPPPPENPWFRIRVEVRVRVLIKVRF